MSAEPRGRGSSKTLNRLLLSATAPADLLPGSGAAACEAALQFLNENSSVVQLNAAKVRKCEAAALFKEFTDAQDDFRGESPGANWDDSNRPGSPSFLGERAKATRLEPTKEAENDFLPKSRRKCTSARGRRGGAQPPRKRNKKRHPSRRSVYKGVTFDTTCGRWRARVHAKDANGVKKRQSLGSYGTEEEAARAYDARVLEISWPDVPRNRLNFPAQTLS